MTFDDLGEQRKNNEPDTDSCGLSWVAAVGRLVWWFTWRRTPMSEHPADQMVVGDVIEWAGRPARILAVLPLLQETRRPGRRFKVLVGIDTFLVSYFDDELVPLAVSHKIYAEARGL